MPFLVGLAGHPLLMERGGGVDPGSGAEPDRNSVLLGPFKTPCDQSLGYHDVLRVSTGLLAQSCRDPETYYRC